MATEATESRSRLGRYELIRPLAVGGMAELHVARLVGPAGFEKTVVIKQVRPALSSSPSFVDMFLDEARLAAQLRHPNIVQVLDLGCDDDRWFIVMEYLRGHDLWSILSALWHRDEVMPLPHAIAIVMGVCAGLHHAHELVDDEGRSREIVHRDVSPRNVVVTFDGAVKLVDFGIAKATQRRTETNCGELKGKLRYMSPEQVRREPVDRRADVFAVAAILWELTVGRRFFEGKSDDEVIEALTEGRVRLPSEVVPDYPAELERVVMRGLAFEREARWPTTEAMGHALAAFASAHGVQPATSKLGELLRSLFADAPQPAPPPRLQRTVPAPDTHSLETMTMMPASRWLPRRSHMWLLIAAVGVLVGALVGHHRPAAPQPRMPTPVFHDERVRPAPPMAPSPAAERPQMRETPPPPERATHHHHHHHPSRGARKPLSDNLDALME